MNHPTRAGASPPQGRGAGDRRRTGDARARTRARRDRLFQRLRHHGARPRAKAARSSTSASCPTASTRPPPPCAARAICGADILVTTGGASVGDYDLVQKALAAEGLALSFWKVALRPGRPMMHGRLGAMHVLGLPGNPVSAYVCAFLFLVPLIRRLAGRADVDAAARAGACSAATCRPTTSAPTICAPRSHPAPDGRWSRRPLPIQDSSMLTPLAQRRLPARARAARPAPRPAQCRHPARQRCCRRSLSLARFSGLSTCSRQIKWLRNTYRTYSVRS